MFANQFNGVYRGVRVLVTGDTGFKGSWMCVWLKELLATVIGFSTNSAPEGTERNFRLCHLSEKIFHTNGDIRNADDVEKAIQVGQPDIVFHFAAQPLVSVSYEEPKRTFDTNNGGVVNLFEAVRKSKTVKVVVCITTDKVYANQNWVYQYREIDNLGGHDPYSASKAQVEFTVSSYRASWSEREFSDHPVSIATARGGNVIGGGDFARDRLVPDCMQAFMSGKEMFVRSPSAIRPWQHVLDLLSGYLALGARMLTAKDEYTQAWNFGPAEANDINCEAVVKKIIELWGHGEYKTGIPSTDAFHETHLLKLDSSKAAHFLSWRAAYNWEEAVRATADWFKEYARQRASDAGIDMYHVCVRQIEEYVKRAQLLRIPWANPRA